MRKIDPARAILVFWADLTFHEAALLADDDAKHLAPAVTKALDDFDAVFKIDLDTRRGVLKANAKSSVADAHLNERIRKLHSAALFLVNQVRKRPEFNSLFSESIDKVIRFALKRQVDVAEKLVETLGLKIYSDDFRTAHVGALQTLVTKGRTILGEVRAAEIARTEARLDIRAQKDDVNALRLANYGELTTIAATTGRQRDWVEAFYLDVKSTPEENDDDADAQTGDTSAPTP